MKNICETLFPCFSEKKTLDKYGEELSRAIYGSDSLKRDLFYEYDCNQNEESNFCLRRISRNQVYYQCLDCHSQKYIICSYCFNQMNDHHGHDVLIQINKASKLNLNEQKNQLICDCGFFGIFCRSHLKAAASAQNPNNSLQQNVDQKLEQPQKFKLQQNKYNTNEQQKNIQILVQNQSINNSSNDQFKQNDKLNKSVREKIIKVMKTRIQKYIKEKNVQQMNLFMQSLISYIASRNLQNGQAIVCTPILSIIKSALLEESIHVSNNFSSIIKKQNQNTNTTNYSHKNRDLNGISQVPSNSNLKQQQEATIIVCEKGVDNIGTANNIEGKICSANCKNCVLSVNGIIINCQGNQSNNDGSNKNNFKQDNKKTEINSNMLLSCSNTLSININQNNSNSEVLLESLLKFY
ncbi:zinc finger in N-recognin (macronuclear) [Tetrahymena thermophila SB210]|uniref:Zinc finger in N-recognin n=1 Tax=Tetrahymena thermophila (strain SB210) TaxID=312017 RepID=I7M5Z7_TETTS|nr:zinc finger in N-recognin [Tetrahymena thermophila SB210]EAR83928.2 zinc finger in N-recognin [Tetrahymena thermophila SB210]|eukprot:XP_001031591.2 zinc finger in N-recognin [Tetrahymena thermophila SB210]